MKKETMDIVIKRWTQDADFRDSFRKDPQAALAECGVQPTNEERAALGELRGLDDAALQERMSKFGTC
jgi:hypothetical protein